MIIINNKKPLEDLVVLDLSRVLAGPFCTMLLKDLGAEIIKVERPETGDDSRHFGPFIEGRSAYFISLNWGKKSITLNLKDEEDRNTFLGLVKKVDILVENFRPTTMEKLNLDYNTLKEYNEKLIYAAISGFGHSGPYSDKAAYDMIVQAAGGIMSITGEPDRPPVRVGASIGDIVAALFATVGILAAVHERKKTGKGKKVDIAMLDSQIAILENAIARYTASGEAPGPLGNRHPSITPFQAFKAKDEWFIIAVGNDNIWAKFCEAIGREDLIDDPRFKTNDKRTENREELVEIINDFVIDKKADDVIELLDNHGVPAGPINDVEDLFNHPQVEARNMLVDVVDPDDGRFTIAGNPIKLSDTQDETERERAPKLGEHTEEIIKKYLG
ncbi:MAG TPA: CoA transferase [Halanaerobiales bacterium]|nr:CoA transferase [Halanaerobiales bacterium]